MAVGKMLVLMMGFELHFGSVGDDRFIMGLALLAAFCCLIVFDGRLYSGTQNDV
jgi:hypothetical protein